MSTKIKHAKTSLLFSLILTTMSAAVAIGEPYYKILTARGGFNIFTIPHVSQWGGVVLQGTTKFHNNSGEIVSPSSLKLQLDSRQLDKSEQVCILYKETCYGLGMSSQNAIPLAKWVFSGQTGAFTLFPPPENAKKDFRKFKGKFAYDGKPSFLPAELNQGTIPQLLEYIDYGLFTEPFDDRKIRNKYNERLDSDSKKLLDLNINKIINQDFSRLPFDIKGSYINTDTDTNYDAKLTNNNVQLTGLIKRYDWISFKGGEYPYIFKIEKACDAESIRSTSNKNCSLAKNSKLRSKKDITPQDIKYITEYIYGLQKEAISLPQITAIFRTFADNNCEELSRFIKENSKTYNFPTNQCVKLRELAKK
jgi:hypothetical protein